jgi:hypothetical protein
VPQNGESDVLSCFLLGSVLSEGGGSHRVGCV